MWIILLTLFICSFVFYGIVVSFKQEDNNDNISKILGANLSLMMCVCMVTFIVCNLHSSMITPIIEEYENGKIIKHEKIVIEDTDTIKVIKYKYKF